LKKNLPPYIIFSDTTLKEIATRFPKNPEEFHSITGVGDHKLRKYGDIFLAEIEHYRRDYDLLSGGKTECQVSAGKESENEGMIAKSIGQKDETSELKAGIDVFGTKVPIPESDKIKNSEICRLPAKRARYLDMSIQDWSETDSSVDNSKQTASIASPPESEVSDLLKIYPLKADSFESNFIKANSLIADSPEVDFPEVDSIETESMEIDYIEAESYKKEPFEAKNLETGSLQMTYSLFTQGLEIDQIAEIQGLSTGAVFRQFEQLILTGKVRDIGELLPPKKQQQIKTALEVLETELDSLIRAKIGEKCKEEELKFVRALLLSKICFSHS
jgi:ATP-dependent DNA helicase RecQ